MQKKVVIISDSQSYLVLSMKEKMEEQGWIAEIVKSSVTEINHVAEDSDAFLLYCDEKLAENKEVLHFLKDEANEKDILIFATGNDDELSQVQKVISKPYLRQCFLRPINVKEVMEVMEEAIEQFGSRTKKKILVVDDSGAMLRNVKGWLEDKYQVILANSGTMAIKFLATNRPDLVLLDYEMPVIDGKQVLEMIRSESEFRDVPVIFLTSKDDKESVLQVMSLKPEGYLLKTMEPSKIVATVDDFFVKQKMKQLGKV